MSVRTPQYCWKAEIFKAEKTGNPAVSKANDNTDSCSTASLCDETPKSKPLSLLHGNEREQIGTANPNFTPRKPWFAQVGNKLIAGAQK